MPRGLSGAAQRADWFLDADEAEAGRAAGTHAGAVVLDDEALAEGADSIAAQAALEQGYLLEALLLCAVERHQALLPKRWPLPTSSVHGTSQFGPV